MTPFFFPLGFRIKECCTVPWYRLSSLLAVGSYPDEQIVVTLSYYTDTFVYKQLFWKNTRA